MTSNIKDETEVEGREGSVQGVWERDQREEYQFGVVIEVICVGEESVERSNRTGFTLGPEEICMTKRV